MSVDTYARKASFSAYRRIRSQGIELLVSRALFAKAALLQIESRKFLWFKWLTVRAQLHGHPT